MVDLKLNFSLWSLFLSTDFGLSQFFRKLFLLNSSNSVNHFKIQNWFGYCRLRNRYIPNNSNGKYIFFTTLLSCVQIVIYSKWYINGYSLLDLFMVWMGYSKVIDQMLVVGCPYFTWYIPKIYNQVSNGRYSLQWTMLNWYLSKHSKNYFIWEYLLLGKEHPW